MKIEVLNYSLKEFDALFFEFFDKKSNPSLLTKQEFYTYTIQIAIFQIDWRHCIQIKRNCCYKQKKWFAEAYEDYLVLKASQKK
jgi:hypothetical protein